MAQADSKNSITASADTKSRRAFLIVAAVGSVAGAGSLAFAAAPNDVPKAVTVPPSPAIAGHDPVFGLIADKRAADIAHGEAIDAQDEADGRYGFHSDEASEADDRCLAACHAVRAIDWKLATTPPTTLAGVAAVLRFANEIEDAGMEWPHTDAIGREGWALPTTGDHGGGDRGDHSPDGGMRAMSDNVHHVPRTGRPFPQAEDHSGHQRIA